MVFSIAWELSFCVGVWEFGSVGGEEMTTIEDVVSTFDIGQ